MAFCGRPTSLKAPAKPKPCNKAKGKCDDPWGAVGKPWLSLLAVDNFNGKKNNTQCDNRFHRLLRCIQITQCGTGQGDTVGDGKRG